MHHSFYRTISYNCLIINHTHILSTAPFIFLPIHAGDFYQLIDDIVVPCLIGIDLICIAKEGKLVYLMDEAKMDSLGVECLCQGVANSVEEIQGSQTGSTKVINNHQLLILNNDKTYNVMGVEVGE